MFLKYVVPQRVQLGTISSHFFARLEKIVRSALAHIFQLETTVFYFKAFSKRVVDHKLSVTSYDFSFFLRLKKAFRAQCVSQASA